MKISNGEIIQGGQNADGSLAIKEGQLVSDAPSRINNQVIKKIDDLIKAEKELRSIESKADAADNDFEDMRAVLKRKFDPMFKSPVEAGSFLANVKKGQLDRAKSIGAKSPNFKEKEAMNIAKEYLNAKKKADEMDKKVDQAASKVSKLQGDITKMMGKLPNQMRRMVIRAMSGKKYNEAKRVLTLG